MVTDPLIVAATKIARSTTAIPDNPELFGPSLAQVVKIEDGREMLLGQAWLAEQNTLITCGHVIEQFVQSPSSVVVKFPSSGNRYAVQSIRLHPSFVRQPDQLVKFDVAALSVNLSHPEVSARPLPFAFEHQLRSNQMLATVRYPVHLGQLSASPEPLAQEGRFLGYLRKHDNFHLLHDLALSPGDSGAPLFDGPTVVAIHCGDTATLPGLNLPTTSIRLGLWVDSLRELGIAETAGPVPVSPMQFLITNSLAFLLPLILTMAIFAGLAYPKLEQRWHIQQPVLLPLDVSFNKPLKAFQLGDLSHIAVVPRSDSYLYVFDVDQANHVLMLYPPYGLPAFVKAGQSRVIDRFGRKLLKVNRDKDKLHLVSLISNYPIVSGSDWNHSDPSGSPLTIDGNELASRIAEYEKIEPSKVLHLVMDAPSAQ